jgi:hypothetical protein
VNPSADMDPHPAPVESPDDELPDVESARRRWRSAAEALFPTLIADPPSYARALETIGAMARELGERRADLAALAAAMADPDAFIAGCGQRPYGAVPPVLLTGVACGMRERDLIAEQVRRDHRSALERCRTTGTTWAVLNGPERIEDVTGGASGIASCTHLHVPSGVELRATVDAWSPEPYRIDVIAPGVVPPQGRSFTRREPWIEEFRRCRHEIGESP